MHRKAGDPQSQDLICSAALTCGSMDHTGGRSSDSGADNPAGAANPQVHTMHTDSTHKHSMLQLRPWLCLYNCQMILLAAHLVLGERTHRDNMRKHATYKCTMYKPPCGTDSSQPLIHAWAA